MAVLELGIEIKNLGTATSGLKDLQSLLNSFKAVKIDVGADALKLARVEAVQFGNTLKKEQSDARIETEKARKALVEYNLEQKKLRTDSKGILTPYQELSRELTQMRNEAKSLGAQMILLDKAGMASGVTYNTLKNKFDESKKSVVELDASFKRLDSSLGQNQRDVGNYAKGTRNAMGVTMEFNRIIQDAPFGMMGISNNLTQLIDNWGLYTRATREAAAASGQSVTTMSLLKGAVGSIFSPMNLLALGVSAVTSGFILYEKWQQKANKATKESKSELDKYRESMNSFQLAQQQSVSSYGQEISKLGALFSITQDVNSSIDQRQRALSKLQDMYPQVFKNLDIESVKTSAAKDSYNSLRDSIISAAKAKAAFAKIGELAATDFTNSERQLALSNEYTQILKTIAALQKRAKSLEKQANSGVVIGQIYTQIGVLEERANELSKQSLSIQKERTKTSEEQNRLAEYGIKNEKQNIELQDGLTGAINGTTNSLKDSVKEAKTLSEILKGLYSAAGISEKDLSLVGNVGLDLQLGSLAFDFNKAIEEVKVYQQSVLKDTTLTEEKRVALIQETERTIQYIMGRASAEMITARDKFNEQFLKRVEIKPIKTGVAEIPLLEETKVPEWMKENKRLTKELSKEITNIIGMLPQLSGGFQEIFNSLTGGIGALFQKELIDNLSQSLSAKMKEMDEDTKKIAGALSIAGNTLQGLFSKSSSVGQGLGGALSGAGAGLGIGNMLKDTLGKNGGIIGAVAGGLVGLVSGIFGARKKRKEEERQRQQLAEQKRTNALLERMNALAYTANIIGGKTLDGIVTGVNRNEFGEITFRIQGRDLVASLDKQKALNSR